METEKDLRPSEVSGSGDGAARTGRPWWAIAALAAIAVLTLALYTWSLSRNGMANSYYAAAVKSATLSWKAFFFGSLDPGSFITVDKLPASVWLMALSGRLFGFSSWSMLLPQALAGLASVLVLHHLVRRWRGEVAALLAALTFALTPVATLIFRYNNPDALLTLLLLLAAWAVWSAVEKGSTWRLVLGGFVLGLALLTKMLMALLVLPAFAVLYLLCGPHGLKRRLLQSCAALATMAISAGWWIAIAQAWPQTARPHVGGTLTDSWIDLILGRSAGLLDSASQGANLSGDPGWLRLFNAQLGGQAAWFLPLALLGLGVGLAVTLRSGRTERERAGYVLWGLWLLTVAAVFSGVQGTLHSYYTVLLVPAVSALVGAGSVEMWELGRRLRHWAFLLPLGIAGSAAWSAVLLSRVDASGTWLMIVVLAAGVAGAAVVLVVLLRPRMLVRGTFRYVGVGLAIVALTAGPLAYSLSTVGRSISGSTAVAGPVAEGAAAIAADDPEADVDEGLVAYLTANRQGARYLVAVQTSAKSVPIILATGEPVVTVGGYKSRDPYPSLAELQGLVAAGDLRYVYITSERVRSSSSAGASTSDDAVVDTKEVLQAVVDWVIENGVVVDPAEYGGSATSSSGISQGTLYLLSGT